MPDPGPRTSARRGFAAIGAGRAILVGTAAALGLIAAMIAFGAAGLIDPTRAFFITNGSQAVVAFLGAAGCAGAARRSRGVSARIWRMMALGLLCWTLGSIPYLLFVAHGGDLLSPPQWTQTGYLLAYPFWYRALWLLRSPAVAERALRRLDRLFVEISALVAISVAVGAVLWVAPMDASTNVSLLLPVALDMLLVAGIYAALRRSPLALRASQAWIAAGFIILTLTDGFTIYLLPRGVNAFIAVLQFGYPLAMATLGVASTRPLRLTLARTSLSRSTLAVGCVAMAALVAAKAALGREYLPAALGMATLLLWRMLAMLARQSDADTDPISGYLAAQAFERYVAGMTTAASAERPALVLAVGFDDLQTWTQTHGAAAAESLFARLPDRLETLHGAGAWGRLDGEHFAFATATTGIDDARGLAETIQQHVGDLAPALRPFVGIALAPRDAADAPATIVAAREALDAGRLARRRVTAFDRGLLDGLEPRSDVASSARLRRERVQQVLADEDSTWVAFHAIRDVPADVTLGYECLSRFRPEPLAPPDVWIAEARSVGLCLDLEAALIRRALVNLPRIARCQFLALNAGPELIMSPLMDEAIGDRPLDQVVIEITEQQAVADYSTLAARLAELRERGARIAIDDAGAGHASLRHIMQLRPDFIKLDQSIIRDVHVDPSRRAVVRTLLEMSRELGAHLIAEGVESEHELAVLRDIGVDLAQGYHFGRPSPDLSDPATVARSRALAEAAAALVRGPAQPA